MLRRQLTVQVLVLKWEFCPQLTQVFFKILQYEMAPGLTELCLCCLYPKTVTRWSPGYHFESFELHNRLKQVWFVGVAHTCSRATHRRVQPGLPSYLCFAL